MGGEYCLKMNLIAPPPRKIRSRHERLHNLKCLQEDFTTLNNLKKYHKRNVSFWYKILTVRMLNSVFPLISAWSQISTATLTLTQEQAPHLKMRRLLEI